MPKMIADNDLHIHSYLSACSCDPLQNPDAILEYAKQNSFKTVCLTNHYFDPEFYNGRIWHHTQTFDYISQHKNLPQVDGIRFLFGCECDMDMDCNIGISKKYYDEFDFILVSTTHLHINGYSVRGDETAKERAILWSKRFETVLNSDLPLERVGLAHLTSCHISEDDYLEVLKNIPESEYHRLFSKAAEKGVSIELNIKSLNIKGEELELNLLPFRIAKQEGCKFHFGSDAHRPHQLVGTKENFENLVDLLDLQESDKHPIVYGK